MTFKYLIIILFIVIGVLLFLYYRQQKIQVYKLRYLPMPYYNDIFIDTKTNEIIACPDSCVVFDVAKQKCVKGNRTTILCDQAQYLTETIPNYYKCDRFFLCNMFFETPVKCYSGFCLNINNICGRFENGCHCIYDAKECTDCCEEDN